jgi:aminomethyltransferase
VDWDTLEAIHMERGLPPRLPAVAWRVSQPVYQGSMQVGYATSGCWSPLLKRYLALAHIQEPHYRVGNRVELEITVEHRRKRADARVVKLPFFDPARKKA